MKRFFCSFLLLFICQCHVVQGSSNDLDLLFHFIENKNGKKVKEIVARGVSPDLYSPTKLMTPLACAAQVGESSVFKYLLKHSVNMYQPVLGEHELAVLDIAQRSGRAKILSILREKKIKK